MRLARGDGSGQHVLGPQVDGDIAPGGAGVAHRDAVLADLQHTAIGRARRQGVDAADEIGHEGAGRLTVHLQRRAHLLDHAVVHHHDAVGHAQRLFLVVRHHDGRDPQLALQALDLLAQLHPHDGIQCRQGFVQQQQARRGGQRPRQRNALLLPA